MGETTRPGRSGMNLPSAPEKSKTPEPSAQAWKSFRKNKKRGYVYLLFLFFWMRAIELMVAFHFYPKLTVHQKQQFHGPMMSAITWTTLLLIAIALRQQWARYVLAGWILFSVVLAWSFIPGMPDAIYPTKILRLVIGCTVTYLPVALVLIFSKGIKKLTENG